MVPNWKLWFEKEGEYVFGPGAYAILKAIEEAGTITEGARNLGMSYRYAWGVIKKIEKKLDEKLLETYQGGPAGGGGANLTEVGSRLMERFARYRKELEHVAERA
ncbi:LysR family transcriptional regulator [Candidatus Thorarchaeota archaeon]|nr:MAG: LysR family transcriptional regulator [Candidatus Thorarchaeota archaeon]